MGKSRGLTDFYRLSLPNIGGFNLLPDSDPRRELISFCKVGRKTLKGKMFTNYKRAAFDPTTKDHHASTYGTKSFSVISNHIADSETMPVS